MRLKSIIIKIGLVCQMQKKWKSHKTVVLPSESTSSFAISILLYTTRLIQTTNYSARAPKMFFFFFRILLIYSKCEMLNSPKKHGTINRYARMTRSNAVHDESWNIVWHPNCMSTHLIATLIFIFSLLWISLFFSYFSQIIRKTRTNGFRFGIIQPNEKMLTSWLAFWRVSKHFLI